MSWVFSEVSQLQLVRVGISPSSYSSPAVLFLTSGSITLHVSSFEFWEASRVLKFVELFLCLAPCFPTTYFTISRCPPHPQFEFCLLNSGRLSCLTVSFLLYHQKCLNSKLVRMIIGLTSLLLFLSSQK